MNLEPERTARVSVVIPTRNRSHFLRLALKSVLAQRGVELEIFVVDDGSTDDTQRFLAGIADERLQVVRHERPLGVNAARNAGLARASGRWIAFLDDDDLWAPDKLVQQVEAAKGSAWVYGGIVDIDVRGEIIGGGPPPSARRVVTELPRHNLMPAGSSNVLVESALLKDLDGFDDRLRHVGDWDLWLRLARHGMPHCVSLPLVAYRAHQGQASLDTSGMYEEGRVLQQRHGTSPAAVHRWAAWAYLQAGQRQRALRAYLNAVRAGDRASIARSVVALLHPQPTRARRVLWNDPGPTWQARAGAWVEELAGSVDREPTA